METRHQRIITPQLVLGLGIIALGVLFLLGNMDILDPSSYLRYWPAIILICGLASFFQSQHGPGRIWGLILTFVGAAMLLDRIYFFHISLWDYWPLILVIIGVMMIFKSSIIRRGIATPSFTETKDANDYLKAVAVMGGFKRSNNSQNFQGGELTAIMGGLEIDLRDASMKSDAVIEVFTMMGGIEMRVPDDWLIIIEGFPFMGGLEDKTHPPKDTTKRLIIKGTAVMGGVEVKS
jgi:predicted membrane protein